MFEPWAVGGGIGRARAAGRAQRASKPSEKVQKRWSGGSSTMSLVGRKILPSEGPAITSLVAASRPVCRVRRWLARLAADVIPRWRKMPPAAPSSRPARYAAPYAICSYDVGGDVPDSAAPASGGSRENDARSVPVGPLGGHEPMAGPMRVGVSILWRT
jgi:hypothetical protein